MVSSSVSQSKHSAVIGGGACDSWDTGQRRAVPTAPRHTSRKTVPTTVPVEGISDGHQLPDVGRGLDRPRGWATQPRPWRSGEVSNTSSMYSKATAPLCPLCSNKAAFAAGYPKTTRQSTRYHGGDFAQSPGPIEAWRAWKHLHGTLKLLARNRKHASQCVTWDAAQTRDTQERRGPVVGTEPGVFLRWTPNRRWGHPRSNRITSSIEFSCRL